MSILRPQDIIRAARFAVPPQPRPIFAQVADSTCDVTDHWREAGQGEAQVTAYFRHEAGDICRSNDPSDFERGAIPTLTGVMIEGETTSYMHAHDFERVVGGLTVEAIEEWQMQKINE